MIIRKPKLSDTDNFFNMLVNLDNETKFMLFEPGERGTDTSRVKAMIENSESGYHLLLIADDGNEIVGFISAQRGLTNRIKHSAYIVVGIRQAYRGKGIGTKFFQKLDKWAQENKVTRLELTVLCPNTIAKHLYEKNGFVVEGLKKHTVLLDGKYVDEYLMAKIYE